jgi:hypothetical protein
MRGFILILLYYVHAEADKPERREVADGDDGNGEQIIYIATAYNYVDSCDVCT